MMTVTNCKNIRGEIDEAELNQQLSSTTIEHLQTCPACRVFHEERGGLRSLMSSLGTVSAPADFDFRLRARLAREKDVPSGVFAFGKFLIGARSLAVVALALLVIGGGILIRTQLSSRKNDASILTKSANAPIGTASEESRVTAPIANAIPSPTRAVDGALKDRGSVATVKEPKQRRPVSLPANNREQTANAAVPGKSAVRESSGRGPTVITLNEPTDSGTLVLVPIDAQSLRVSIDDGHGSPHTISVPAVSFGSQRVGERGLSFAPVRSTKGVW